MLKLMRGGCSVYAPRCVASVPGEDNTAGAVAQRAFDATSHFLRSLPQWVSESGSAESLQDVPRQYDRFLVALLKDKITVATAVQTKVVYR